MCLAMLIFEKWSGMTTTQTNINYLPFAQILRLVEVLF